MLEVFDLSLAPAEFKARMLAHPACAPFQEWVSRWDLRCVETAGLLVKQWGRRRSASTTAVSAGEG